jgi:glutamyl-tRNA reductase
LPIVVLGLSHRTAPPDVRDRHAFPPGRITEALGVLHEYTAVREAAIVSTCNRLEIYADVTEYEDGVAQLKEFLTTYRSMRVDDFDKYLYTMLGAEAVEQLFKVASGLDSMLVGEAEILAQVKEALRAAEAAGTAGSNLHRLFRKALETGKRARTETAIGSDAVSLGSAAVELAARHCDVKSTYAVVVGAGKMGGIVARHLSARGAASLVIANRTVSKAKRLAHAIGGDGAGLDDLPALLANADLVISAVGAGTPLITAHTLQLAMRRRAGRRLLIIDVGTPRDVEIAARDIDGVTVYELADLRHVVATHLERRRGEIPAVEAIVAASVLSYTRWYVSRAAAPLIADLRRRAEVVRATEIEKLFANLENLSDRDRELIESASQAIVNRLLHAPVTQLRESIADRSQDALESDALQSLLDVDGLHRDLERDLRETLAPVAKRHEE